MDMLPSSITLDDFALLFDAAPSPYLVLTPDLTIAAVNSAYARATMTVPQEIIGRHLFDVFPDNPDDPGATGTRNLALSLERVNKFRRPDPMAIQKYDIPRAASQGGGFEERYWSPLNTPVLGKDGQVLWIIHRVEDVTDLVHRQEEETAREQLTREQQGIIDQLRETVKELAVQIEERKLAEAELARIEHFLNLIIENVPAMLFVKDAAEYRFSLINRFGEQLLGYDRTELTGKSDYDFFPKEQADFFISRDREVLISGKTQFIPEETITTRSGEVRILKTAKIPVLDEMGRPQFLLGLSEDITDRRKTEQQLVQTQKMEAIGNLTGGLAHDFNNLLGIIVGNLDLLHSAKASDPLAEELVREALDAALRGAELTKHLLAFARKQPLKPQQVDMNELVRGISKLFTRTLGEHIEVSLELNEVWPIVADPSQLEASLINLATNARDAMPKGGRLKIKTGKCNLDEDYAAQHVDTFPGNYTLLEVSDTGSGMAQAVMERIFEPFFSTKAPGHGTGLGLSMVFGFIKQSGGHINVYSEEGVGTTFRLYLPRTGAGAESQAEETPFSEVRKGGETVLAVEDDDRLRRVVVRQLTELGYRVLEAENAKKALEVLQAEKVHLLFTDVVMPGGMSGHELAIELLECRPEIKILLTSGFSEANVNGNGHAKLNLPLLSKPYRKDDLARVLRQILDK